MNAQQIAAPGAGPLFIFVSDEKSYAGFLYAHEILDHTHAILGSIALIQAVQAAARKAVTPEAVSGAVVHDLVAGFDTARYAGFRFDAVVAPAAGTCIFLSNICAAQPAVHPTGSDQCRA